MTSPADPLETTIGKYRILELAGEGAMGAVYRARDTVLNRMVAVKVMNATIARDPDLRDRFLREAQSAGSLQHPNVVTIYDFGEVDGHLFIAMEYVEGTDLGTLLADPKGMTLQLRLELMIDVLAGLEYAHQRGIVHRDLKPANIRITPEPRAKLMDFGVAYLESSKITTAGLMVGTPSYMAPEYISGNPVTAVSDIFSMGAVLYEVLTGRQPFLGETLHALLFSVVQQDPPAPSTLVSSLPKTLDAIVSKALAKEPADRYASALDMAQALTSVRASLSGAPFSDSQALSTTLAHRIVSKGGAAARQASMQGRTTPVDAPSVQLEQANVPSRSGRPLMIGVGIGAVVVVAGLIATFQRSRSGGLATSVSHAAPSDAILPTSPVVPPNTVALSGRAGIGSPDTLRNAPLPRPATETRAAASPTVRNSVESSQTRLASPASSTAPKLDALPSGSAHGSAQLGTSALGASSPGAPPPGASTQSASAGSGTSNGGTVGGAGQGTSVPGAPPAPLPTSQPIVSGTAPATVSSTSPNTIPPAVNAPEVLSARNAQAELREVINGYARAISSRDAARVRSAFPGISRDQLKGFEDYFAQCKTLQATFILGAAEVHERGADGTVNGRYECNGKPEKGAVTFHATFERDGDHWRLVSTR